MTPGAIKAMGVSERESFVISGREWYATTAQKFKIGIG